ESWIPTTRLVGGISIPHTERRLGIPYRFLFSIPFSALIDFYFFFHRYCTGNFCFFFHRFLLLLLLTTKNACTLSLFFFSFLFCKIDFVFLFSIF
ncbi:hypothetical protein ERO13_D09G053044v2, partial [Gossypium hirsutum]